MQHNHIRNFCIIAHIDHGKSTLSDRFLELTKTIAKDKIEEQFLDQNPISRERGITIKLAPVRMIYQSPNVILANEVRPGSLDNVTGRGDSGQARMTEKNEFILNLIDTPGHVDFSYEVSRTLAACEGAILLIDATKGIQAQTVAHYRAAVKEGLTIIPAINKIDLDNAETDKVAKELSETFGFVESDIHRISAKTGLGVAELLDDVIAKIPPPTGDPSKPLKTLIFDAAYDAYRGVVAYVRVIDGSLKKDDSIVFFQSNVTTTVTEVGHFSPFLVTAPALESGEIGYVITGVKDIRNVRVGDTIMYANNRGEPLAGYTLPKPMVFFGMYPKSSDDFVLLRESLAKLVLNDTALTYTEEYSSYLGSGYRVGFLGLLHAEIVKERLEREFGLDLLLTMPQVLYDKRPDGTVWEPYMMLTVYTPKDYVGGIMTACQRHKGQLLDMTYHDTYAELIYDMPYSMFIRGLSSDIKSQSSGFASVDYELTEYRLANVASLEIKINDEAIDVLSELVYKDEMQSRARSKAEMLKDSLPRQQFRQVIQGVVNGTIVAREEIPPFRKDVLAKMSGGDRTRKDKLLEAQKKGKSRMKTHGKVLLPQQALYSMLERK